MRKNYLDGPFGQIHYYEAGMGPSLILAHQSPVCGRMFERAMPLLAAQGLHVIAVDTPGYGQSDVPRQPPSIAGYADAFVAVVQGLGLGTAHFLGHHTGAAILCNMAARNPGLVSSLVLNGPPVLSAEDLAHFSSLPLRALQVRRDGSHLLEAWNTRVRYSPGWTDEVAMHRRLIDQLWAGDTAWYGHKAAFAHDMAPDLAALRCRTLILTNTGDDAYEMSRRAHALRPDFAYVELAGGTHDIVDEQPEAWTQAVVRFIRSV
ncbi:MAG: alpha/beta fold hydrolase [Steroidobacteraceae bacterium]